MTDATVAPDDKKIVADNHTTVEVPVQEAAGPVVPLNPNAATVKQAVVATVEVPFDPQLVDAHVIVANVERQLRALAEVVNLEFGEVKDWVHAHLTADEAADKAAKADAKDAK